MFSKWNWLVLMSKHSKWAKIKNQKTAADVKKGAVFTKHSRAIAVAARAGADPSANFKLRMAIDSAKAAGVPKDTIERAVKRGAGELADEQIEEIIYEGFGPGGVALLIETATDNRNRTSGNLRHLLEKYGGSLATSGAVVWKFERRGAVRLNQPVSEELELKLIDLGAEDIKEEEGGLTIYLASKNFPPFLEGLGKLRLTPEYQGWEWVAKETVKVEVAESRQKLEEIYQALEEDGDVQNYFSNEE